MKSLKKRRSSTIKLTKEARLLRELRMDLKLSIREVARRIGRSEAYLRHIEKGRADIPSIERLKLILSIYDVTYRQYKKKIENYENEIDYHKQLFDLIKNCEADQAKIILRVTKSILNDFD